MKEWTALVSLLGVLAFCQSIVHSLFPVELRHAVATLFRRVVTFFSGYCYFDIMEMEGVNTNELYNAVHYYLGSSVSIYSGSRLNLARARNSTAFSFGMSDNDTLVDRYNDVEVQWVHVVTERQMPSFSWRPLPDEKRGYTLRLKKDRLSMLNPYLDYIIAKADEIRRESQERQLYTNSRGGTLDARGNPWESVPFKHPSTFETLAMDPEKKKDIMDDLKYFADGQEFYQKTGRAWKRGYLLYGPPGTGKSSMIAAMANYLGYDIYDLELSEVHTNSELRRLLMKTCPKSIIVIEDIDCSISLTNRKMPGMSDRNSNLLFEAKGGNEEGGNAVTLSGLLNFTDGLWSSCGNERIFVFTTNHIERLDPALLRSGRMDMHIHMSYCSPPALRILVENYIDCDAGNKVGDNGLMKEITMVIGKARMTPADVSEVLLKNRRDREKALRELLEALKVRAEANERNWKDGEEDEQEKRALESPKEKSPENEGHFKVGEVRFEKGKNAL